jgi:hypothetical protein
MLIRTLALSCVSRHITEGSNLNSYGIEDHKTYISPIVCHSFLLSCNRVVTSTVNSATELRVYAANRLVLRRRKEKGTAVKTRQQTT